MHLFKMLSVGFGLFAGAGAPLFVFPLQAAAKDEQQDVQVLTGSFNCLEYRGGTSEHLGITGSAFPYWEFSGGLPVGRCVDRLRPMLTAVGCSVGQPIPDGFNFSYSFACSGTMAEVNAAVATMLRTLYRMDSVVANGPHVLFVAYDCTEVFATRISTAGVSFTGSAITGRGVLQTSGRPPNCDTDDTRAVLDSAGCTIANFRDDRLPAERDVSFLYVCDGTAAQLNATIAKLAQMVVAP